MKTAEVGAAMRADATCSEMSPDTRTREGTLLTGLMAGETGRIGYCCVWDSHGLGWGMQYSPSASI